jgi:hypothetical protein
VPTKGVQVFLGHQKHRTFPLDLVCPERLSVQSLTSLPYVVATQIATKKQLKDLTHMLCS